MKRLYEEYRKASISEDDYLAFGAFLHSLQPEVRERLEDLSLNEYRELVESGQGPSENDFIYTEPTISETLASHKKKLSQNNI